MTSKCQLEDVLHAPRTLQLISDSLTCCPSSRHLGSAINISQARGRLISDFSVCQSAWYDRVDSRGQHISFSDIWAVKYLACLLTLSCLATETTVQAEVRPLYNKNTPYITKGNFKVIHFNLFRAFKLNSVKYTVITTALHSTIMPWIFRTAFLILVSAHFTIIEADIFFNPLKPKSSPVSGKHLIISGSQVRRLHLCFTRSEFSFLSVHSLPAVKH